MSVTYTADGTQREFSFPFDYLRKAFVKVEVNEETILVQGTDYYVSDNKTVVLTTAPIAGTTVRVFRQTDTTRLVSWADASVLRAKDMTVQQVQELHLLEENTAYFEDIALLRNGKIWESRGMPLRNVGSPVNPNDAATKRYIDDIINGYIVQGDKFCVFDSVGQMRTANLIPSQYVATSGYATPNDGGASVYFIRAAIAGDVDDDEFIIILDNNNVAERIANLGFTNEFGINLNGEFSQIIDE